MNGKWKRYPAFRDSEAPWIGRIPKGWDTIELRRLVAALRPITYGIVQPGALDPSGIPMVRGQDYSGGWVSTERMFHVSPEIELPYRRSRLAPNDILMTIVGAGVGNVAIVPDWLKQANITQTTARIAVDGRLASHRFIAYALRSNVGQACVRTSTKGAAQPGLTLASVSRFRIPLPPLDAQQSIAAFLDRETARIDALVAKKERLIELLQEKRTALISHAVTRGLNPNAPLRDSGIPWLGQIPEHWEVKRLKFIADVRSGAAKGRDFGGRDTMEVPYLRVANVQDGFLDLADVATILIAKAELRRYSLRKNDVLMNEGGDYDKLGRGSVWTGQIDPCVHQNHVFAVRPNRSDDAEWISTVTQTTSAKFYFMARSKQSTNLASISATNIQEVPLVMPPEAERQEILKKVVRETAKLDALIAKIRTAIDRLQEYRTALISAAVTGQIDVRDAVGQGT